MDSTWLWGAVGAIAAAIGAWIKRGTIVRAGSAIGDFFATHKNLQTCRSELANLASSVSRERESMAAELVMRDRTEAYLTSRLEMLLAQAEKVSQAHRQGLVTASENSENGPRHSRATSRRSQLRQGSEMARSRSRPVIGNGTRKRDDREPT